MRAAEVAEVELIKFYVFLAVVGAAISLTGLVWCFPEWDQLYRSFKVFHDAKGSDLFMLTKLATQMQTHRINVYAEALGSIVGLLTFVGAMLGISIERVRLALLLPRA
jgi:hypothetical protein